MSRLDELVTLGRELSGNSDRRLLWLELMKAINRSLPQDPDVAATEIPDPKEKPISQRQDLHIEYVESEYFPDLTTWFTDAVKTKYLEDLARIAKPAADPDATEPAAAAAEVTGPTGPGWVIEIKGHHFFNEDTKTWGGTHVRNTLLKNLREQKIALPTGPGKELVEFSMEELGIGFPILAVETRIDKNYRIPNPYFEGSPDAAGSGRGARTPEGGLGLGDLTSKPAAKPEEEAKEKEDMGPPFYIVPRFDFVVQFCWQEVQLTERLQLKREQEEQAELERQNAPENQTQGPDASVAANPTGG